MSAVAAAFFFIAENKEGSTKNTDLFGQKASNLLEAFGKVCKIKKKNGIIFSGLCHYFINVLHVSSSDL